MEGLSLGWTIARIIVHAAAGAGIFMGIYQILLLGYKGAWISKGWNYLLEHTKQVQQKREQNYQRQYEEVGILEKIPLVQRWDQMYAQSMIQHQFPELNAQLYVSLLLVVASITGLCGLLFWHKTPGYGALAGVCLFLLVLFCGMFYVNLLRRQKKAQTEKELVPFLNIVDNFSKSEQDLFQIFELAVPYLKEPIKTALAESGQHAATTGNRSEAIRDLIYRIEHPKFREMIQNLEICSKNEANYTRIMSDMRDGLSAYMSNRKEERGILKEGQIQIIVIICMGIPMVAMLSVITQVPLLSMAENFFGRLIIGYWVVLLIFIVYQMFFRTTGRES
ncbi:MAG: hypothetical protein IJ471_09320 [Eubacterium sp.]|nr:hypothetical protein [Eubacterium sp.]